MDLVRNFASIPKSEKKLQLVIINVPGQNKVCVCVCVCMRSCLWFRG